MNFFISLHLISFIIGLTKGGLPLPLAFFIFPYLLIYFQVKQTAGLVLPILLVSDIFTLILYRDQWRLFSKAFKFFPWQLVGIVVAMAGFAILNNDQLGFIIGILCVFIALLRIFLNDRYEKIIARWRSVWFFLAGYTSFVLNMGGPFMRFGFLSEKYDKTTFIVLLTFAFFLLNLTKLPLFEYLNILPSRSLFTQYIYLLPSALIGVYLGKKTQMLFSNKLYFIFVDLSILAVGLALIYQFNLFF